MATEEAVPILHDEKHWSDTAQYEALVQEHMSEIETLHGERKRAPLHFAASAGHIDALRVLLRNGANIESRDGDERTPLSLASSATIVTELVAYGANLEAADKDGHRALHLAIHWGKTEVAFELMSQGADREATDKRGKTALNLAIVFNRTDVAMKLLELGANINTIGRDDYTALANAASFGQLEMVKELLSRGADMRPYKRAVPPLQAAAHYNFPEVVGYLVEHGADVNERDEVNRTAIHVAGQLPRYHAHLHRGKLSGLSGR